MTRESSGSPRDSGSRFAKGESGNPRGRPRKTPEPRPSAFDVVLDRRLTINRDGAPQEVGIEEALQHKTLQEAFAGKRLAERQVLKWILKREAWKAEKAASKGSRITRVTEKPAPENAKEALELLGIVTRHEGFDESDEYFPRQLLEVWAVQAALDRRHRQPPLSGNKVYEIERCTLKRGDIRWPKGSRR